MNDQKKLHKTFVKLGNDRRKLTNELLALLPEIYEKEIYKKYAGSIVEYAGKFGGLSRNVVLKRLRLEKYLKDKPKLKGVIKTEGLHKVAMMASLATHENEEFLVDKLRNMSKSAIQELSKEMRSKQVDKEIGLFGNDFLNAADEPNCKAVPQKITIELDEEMSFLFLKLKKKIGKNLSNKEIMKKILEMAENKQPTDQKTLPGDNSKIAITNYTLAKPITRYIPSRIKKQIMIKTNGKCSYPNCNKPAEVFHHAERFAEKSSHDSLKLLCKIHHEFAHNGLIKNEKKEVDHWEFGLGSKGLSGIDERYRSHRLK